jgi:hypothetical protein
MLTLPMLLLPLLLLLRLQLLLLELAAWRFLPAACCLMLPV